MLKSKLTSTEQPIIVVQDTNHGNISTTNDILNQLKLYQYSQNLKNVNLDRFMQMTDEKDFEQYGIHKQGHCRRLSLCAQSIRRTSLSSSISFATTNTSTTTADDEDRDFKDYPDSPAVIPSDPLIGNSNVSFFSLNTPMMTTNSNIFANDNNAEQTFSLRDLVDDYFGDDDQHIYQPWPNSILKRLPPRYVEDYRRYSLPSLIPPEYADSVLDKRRHSDGVQHKTTGEGKEKLPGYTCTVQKMGKGKAKVEYNSPGKRSRRRPWKDVYLELQGTFLKVYEFKNNTATVGGYHYLPTLTAYYQQPFKYNLLFTVPLADTKAEVAVDYTKRDHVFRVTTKNGPQLLIQVQTNVSVSDWIEKLASGSNIAVDLEHQRMPSFTPSPIEPYAGWGSSTSRERYQGYMNEELLRRNSASVDALV